MEAEERHTVQDTHLVATPAGLAAAVSHTLPAAALGRRVAAHPADRIVAVRPAAHKPVGVLARKPAAAGDGMSAAAGRNRLVVVGSPLAAGRSRRRELRTGLVEEDHPDVHPSRPERRRSYRWRRAGVSRAALG